MSQNAVETADMKAQPSRQQPTTNDYTPPNPTLRLLFSLVSRRDRFFLIVPAIIISIVAGGIAPFMTYLIGQIFNTFAVFAIITNPTETDKHHFLSGISRSALELTGLGIAAFLLSSITSWFWISVGERNAMRIRKKVYESVAAREMSWYDTKIGTEDAVQTAEGDGPAGAGGLMAKFAKDTDDIRMASSLACGMVTQYLTTCIACLVLGFARSWSLTLLILSAVPVMMAIQFLTQVTAGPLIGVERARIASAATLVDRAVSAIATVKAFNAEEAEIATFAAIAEKLRLAAWNLNRTWAFTSGFTQFTVMAMFVQGFWFGAKLVRGGHASAGDVMAVFWACLIATTNLQMCIPHIVTLTKGKCAMAALVALIEAPTPVPAHHANVFRTLPSRRRRSANLRGIVPQQCKGSLNLANVYFSYPSRPDVPVLEDVSMFLPAQEMTFIVGSSGSGKSTIAQLLLRMYDPNEGTISLDDQDVQFLDAEWTRRHIGAVSQGAILFDMTVHENVAMGLASPGSLRKPDHATRAEIVAACQVALMQRFVQDLPLGYDTPLGNGGANLSGGQKQRLAIARAMLRDPTILILDEATSALDATSRVLVFEAIKRWRTNKTTIVITHDLSQITPNDFVYVLKDGRVAEQGYRHDLELASGEFHRMAEVQGVSLTGDDAESWSEDAVRAHAEKYEHMLDVENARAPTPQDQRPLTYGNWMLDAVQDLTGFHAAPTAVTQSRAPQSVNRFGVGSPNMDYPPAYGHGHARRPSTLAIEIPAPLPAAMTTEKHRYSLQFSPTSPPPYGSSGFASSMTLLGDQHSVIDEKEDDDKTRFPRVHRHVTRRDRATLRPYKEVTVNVDSQPKEVKQESTWQLIKEVYPTIPYKPLLFLGLLFSVISGAITPIFSFMLSRLFYEVSVGARNVGLIDTFGGIVLAIAVADGLFMGLKYFVLETSAMFWVTKLRNSCYRLVLNQDKKWFDKTENTGARLVQILIKDGDDARSLIATVLGHAVVVTSMLTIGLVWALVWGWQLTLVGFAIAPVFGATMVVQTNLVTKFEVRNKRAREEVAKGYYDTILNIRGIRSMGFESVFLQRFEKAVDAALRTGVRGAFVEGCTYGVASSLIYMSEALLFYVGARLIVTGTYTYLQFVQVLNLVVFSVSIGSQLMAFTQRIAKSVAATRDWNRILKLSQDTDESRGHLTPPIEGSISFKSVSFAYPERADVPVLRNTSLTIHEGESVAIVGSSGSGKSTVAALLQRLYEPAAGAIFVGPWELKNIDAHHLRENVSVVSQSANLFDASIAENIAYGAIGLTQDDIVEAAKQANVHDFIMSLPQGYDTMVGENAALISGGQAQRLQIARALARPARILILDECTSALDGTSQAAVLDAVLGAREGRTTIMVTHKLPVMKMCDRIIVLDGGAVAEVGTYDELIARRGVFAQLAGGGEWSL